MECGPTRLAVPPLALPNSWGISIFVPVESSESFVIIVPFTVMWRSVSSKSDALRCNRLVIRRSLIFSLDVDWFFIQTRAAPVRRTRPFTHALLKLLMSYCSCLNVFITFCLLFSFNWTLHTFFSSLWITFRSNNFVNTLPLSSGFSNDFWQWTMCVCGSPLQSTMKKHEKNY